MDKTDKLVHKILFRFLFFLSLTIGTGPCFSEIYKWVDENGKVHFSDKKINSLDQKVVNFDGALSDWSRFDIKIKTKGVVLSEKENQDIVDGVNIVYEFFDRVLFFDLYKTVPVNILLLKDKQEYRKYLHQKNKGHLSSSYGVYLAKENQIVVYIQKDRQRTFKTIRHEVSHAVVDTITPYAPAWLNEGLAEQMETLKGKDGGLYLETHTRNRRSVSEATKNKQLANIDEFLKLPSKKWRHSLASGENTLQAQAGQFVYFLLLTPTNRSFVVRLMHNFERGDRTLSYYLVNKNYIGGIKTLEVTWENWLRRQDKGIIVL